MGDFKIEKGVPVPSGRGNKNNRFPFLEMGIGDSFFVPITDTDDFTGARNRIAQAATHFKNRNAGYNFTTKKEEGGVRCWRIPALTQGADDED